MEEMESQWRISPPNFPLNTEFTYKYYVCKSNETGQLICLEEGEIRKRRLFSTPMHFRDLWETPEHLSSDSLLSPSSSSSTNEPQKEMSSSEFKSHKKKIELAMFMRDSSKLQSALEEFKEALHSTLPPSSEMEEETNKLLTKAENFLQSLPKETKDGNKDLKKRTSLRTRARMSHLKLMGKVASDSSKGDFVLLKCYLESATRTICASRLEHTLCNETIECVDELVELVKDRGDFKLSELKEYLAERLNAINCNEFAEPKDKSWRFEIHSYSIQGSNHQMEDRVVVLPEVNELFKLNKSFPPITFCGIYDGETFNLLSHSQDMQEITLRSFVV